MSYSKEDVVAWLNQHWKNTICPICQSNNWSISDTPVEIRPYTGGGMVIGGPVYPLFSLTCNKCGNTLLFNAIVAGLIPREGTPSPVPAAEEK